MLYHGGDAQDPRGPLNKHEPTTTTHRVRKVNRFSPSACHTKLLSVTRRQQRRIVQQAAVQLELVNNQLSKVKLGFIVIGAEGARAAAMTSGEQWRRLVAVELGRGRVSCLRRAADRGYGGNSVPSAETAPDSL